MKKPKYTQTTMALEDSPRRVNLATTEFEYSVIIDFYTDRAGNWLTGDKYPHQGFRMVFPASVWPKLTKSDVERDENMVSRKYYGILNQKQFDALVELRGLKCTNEPNMGMIGTPGYSPLHTPAIIFENTDDWFSCWTFPTPKPWGWQSKYHLYFEDVMEFLVQKYADWGTITPIEEYYVDLVPAEEED